MRLVCMLMGMAATASLYAQAAPYMEARELVDKGNKIGRGVAAYGTLEDGTRWFYSHAWIGRKGGSETMIESWSKPDGTPIRAIYTAKSGIKTTTTTVTVQDGDAKLVERTEIWGRSPTTREATVKAAPGTVFQMSQFNPIDIPMDPGESSVGLTIIEPVAMQAVQGTLRLLVSGTRSINGRAVGKESRYVLQTSAGESRIRVNENGLLIDSLNSEGMLMRPVEMLPEELSELYGVAQSRGK